MQIDSTRFDPGGIQKLGTFFQRRNPVRNLGEVVFAHNLLIGKIKRRMICRYCVDKPVTKSFPKYFLVTRIPQRGDITNFAPSNSGRSAYVLSNSRYWINVSTLTRAPR